MKFDYHLYSRNGGFLLCILLFWSGSAFELKAQSPLTVAPGDHLLNLGVGLGRNFFNYTYAHTTAAPTLTFSYQHGVVQAGPGVITAGGIFGWNTYSQDLDPVASRLHTYYLSIQGAYHYNWGIEHLDTYGGIQLGTEMRSYRYTPSINFSGVGIGSVFDQYAIFGFYGGAAYYFNSHIGAFGEIGWGLTLLSAGITVKL